MTRKQDQIRGAFLGAAAGDALGLGIQELSWEEIQEQYGPGGMQGYDMPGGYALVSAHTQMALFTANGLLYGQTRGRIRGVMSPYSGYLHLFYKDWAKTQTYGRARPQGKHYAWLCHVPDLYARRLPDRTTMLVLDGTRMGTMTDPVSQSTGAAGLARVFPVGLHMNPKDMSREETALLGAEAAALTHGNPMGFLPGAYLAELVNRLLFDKPQGFRHALHETVAALRPRFVRDYPRAESALREALGQAEELADSTMEPVEAVETLKPDCACGVLAAAAYACLKFPGDFERGIVAAVNHSYDSTATGTVAGALMGTMLGTEGIPDFYLEPLELQNVICTLADDLDQGCPVTRDQRLFDVQWHEKYVESIYEP